MFCSFSFPFEYIFRGLFITFQLSQLKKLLAQSLQDSNGKYQVALIVKPKEKFILSFLRQIVALFFPSILRYCHLSIFITTLYMSSRLYTSDRLYVRNTRKIDVKFLIHDSLKIN